MSVRWRVLVVVLLLSGLLAPARGEAGQEASPTVEWRPVELPGFMVLGLSPDGRWLAAARREELEGGSSTYAELCVFEAETLAAGACADLAVAAIVPDLERLAWAPDGTRLAFTEDAYRRLLDGDVWVMEVATGALVNLTDDGVGGELPILDDPPDGYVADVDTTPAWSPDGRTLAFARSTWRDGAWRGSELYRIAVGDGTAGGAPERVLRVTPEEPGVVYFGLRWSADGARLIYYLGHSDQAHPGNGLWVVDAEGGPARRLAAQTAELGAPIPLEVSARGNLALIAYGNALSSYAFPGSPYALIDLATGGETRVGSAERDALGLPVPGLATFSPGGARLLSSERSLGLTGRLVIRDLDEGDERVVVELPDRVVPIGLGRGLTWAADGTVYVPTAIDAGILLHLEEDEEAPGTIGTTAATQNDRESMATPGGTELGVGSVVVVNDAGVPLRAAPSTRAVIVAELAQGAELTVIGPTEAGDGFVWWPVRDAVTRSIGYVRAEFLTPGASPDR